MSLLIGRICLPDSDCPVKAPSGVIGSRIKAGLRLRRKVGDSYIIQSNSIESATTLMAIKGALKLGSHINRGH